MDAVIVGIDVAKDKLDVGVRPSGERFVVSRTETELEELTDRLRELGVAQERLAVVPGDTSASGAYRVVDRHSARDEVFAANCRFFNS